MQIKGSNTIPLPVEQVWDAILDPAVLVRTIPGCERLVETSPNTYDMTVTAGVAAIKGTYTGTCALSDLVEHESLTMKLRGAGAPGTVDATVAVLFTAADGGTEVSYEADAVVGGMVGGVGQRMLSSVSKRMAGEFFGNVGKAVVEGVPAAAAPVAADPSADGTPAAAPTPGVFTAPAKSSPLSGGDDFLKGIAVGAGLVLVGVLAGALLGRRR